MWNTIHVFEDVFRFTYPIRPCWRTQSYSRIIIQIYPLYTSHILLKIAHAYRVNYPALRLTADSTHPQKRAPWRAKLNK